MYYCNMQAFRLIEEHQQEKGFVYDIVIKFRADIITNHILPINFDICKHQIMIPSGEDYYFEHGSQPGINDQIAYGDFQTMKLYSSLYSSIENYILSRISGYHPEALLLTHLQRHSINITRFDFEYTLDEHRKS